MVTCTCAKGGDNEYDYNLRPLSGVAYFAYIVLQVVKYRNSGIVHDKKVIVNLISKVSRFNGKDTHYEIYLK